MLLPAILYIPLFIGLAAFPSSAIANPEPETVLNSYGDITFTFDKIASVSIAPRGNQPALSGCATADPNEAMNPLSNSAAEGAMRYNKQIRKIEFCDGAVWRVMEGSITIPEHASPGVNYTTCRSAVTNHTTGFPTMFHAWGVTGNNNIKIACATKNQVYTGMDTAPDPLPSSFIDCYCCGLSLK